MKNYKYKSNICSQNIQGVQYIVKVLLFRAVFITIYSRENYKIWNVYWNVMKNEKDIELKKKLDADIAISGVLQAHHCNFIILLTSMFF